MFIKISKININKKIIALTLTIEIDKINLIYKRKSMIFWNFKYKSLIQAKFILKL